MMRTTSAGPGTRKSETSRFPQVRSSCTRISLRTECRIPTRHSDCLLELI